VPAAVLKQLDQDSQFQVTRRNAKVHAAVLKRCSQLLALVALLVLLAAWN